MFLSGMTGAPTPATPDQEQPNGAAAMADDSLDSPQCFVKTCRTCGESKPIADMATLHGKPWRVCKSCVSKKSKEWRAKNPDKARAYKRKWYDANYERVKELSRKHYRKDVETSRLRQQANTYGISVEQLVALYEKHGDRCALCGKPPTGKRSKLFVDHCHDTGRVRGLLCRQCNWALGALGDTIDAMEKALSYVRGIAIETP